MMEKTVIPPPYYRLGSFVRLARYLLAESPASAEQLYARQDLYGSTATPGKREIRYSPQEGTYIVFDGENKYTTSILPEWADRDVIIEIKPIENSKLLIDKLEKINMEMADLDLKKYFDWDQVLKNLRLYYNDTTNNADQPLLSFLEKYSGFLIESKLKIYDDENHARKWAWEGSSFIFELYAQCLFAGDTLIDALASHQLFLYYPGELHILIDKSREILLELSENDKQRNKTQLLPSLQPEIYLANSNLSERATTIWLARSAQFVVKHADELRDIARNSETFLSHYHHLFLAFLHYRVAQKLLSLILLNWGKETIDKYSIKGYYRHSEEMRVVILNALYWGALEHNDRPNVLNPPNFYNWLVSDGESNLEKITSNIYDFELQLIIPKYLSDFLVKLFEFVLDNNNSSFLELTQMIDKFEDLSSLLHSWAEPNYHSLACKMISKKLLEIGKRDLAKHFQEKAGRSTGRNTDNEEPSDIRDKEIKFMLANFPHAQLKDNKENTK